MTLTVGNATANNTESAISRTVAAGSTVVMALFDWNADAGDQTPLAGSGTPTERFDFGNAINYGGWGCAWENTGGDTSNYGPSSYTSLKVAQAIAVVASDTGITSVTQYAEVSNWFASAAGSITGVSWVTGDAIVVVSGCENMVGPSAPPTPSHGSLSFTSVASIGTVGDGTEAGINIRYAIAGSDSGTPQTISLTDPGSQQGGAGLLVIHESTGGAAAGLTVDPSILAKIFIQNEIANVPVWRGSPAAVVGGAELDDMRVGDVILTNIYVGDTLVPKGYVGDLQVHP